MSKERKGSSKPPVALPYHDHQQVLFNARILVVEDNTTNQFVAQSLLTEFGIQADISANGEAAIKALQTVRYDLVFMDCKMPVMDGYNATKRIRNTHSSLLNHNIPIIAMSANVLPEDKEKCLRAGMNDFVPKPFKSNKFLQVLQQWLPKNDHTGKETLAISEPLNEAHSETETVIFDAAAMRLRLMNNKDLIRKVVETFSHDMALQITLLKTAVIDKDFVTAAAQAHKIKGAAANVSGISLNALASVIEDACKTEDLKILFDVLPKIERNFILLKANMGEIV
ncbi:MAG: CheY-like chemotaxis protein/HPt (histidine-containing phosphotransfer) domain-containing protein [Oleispira sp.]|jgi:CheY-like chemotaxis protein/HPt (histidine-containing phosphotransfer) domain-containing protein